MKDFMNFINQYGTTFIHSIAVAFLSYVSYEVKSIYNKHINDKIKKDVVNMVRNAINKMYPNKNYNDKLELIISNCKIILGEKNIKISDLELRMYIEDIK